MPFGADVVPDECMTIARSSAWRALRSAGRSSAAIASTCSGRTSSSVRRSPATSRHFAISFSPPKVTIAVALRLLDQRRELGLVEHRRQRRQHDAAVQAPEHRDRGLDRVAAEQDHDIAGLDAAPASRFETPMAARRSSS